MLMLPGGLIFCLKFIVQGFKVICIHCHIQEQRKQIEPRTRLNKIWGGGGGKKGKWVIGGGGGARNKKGQCVIGEDGDKRKW